MAKLLLGGGGQYEVKDRRIALIEEIKSFLGPSIDRILFVPYALKDYDEYVSKMVELGINAGYQFDSIHRLGDSQNAVSTAQAIYIGGGNTFRLLNELYQKDLIPLIRRKVQNGTPYLGVSAGANIACPTIKTTNDMPIVEPPSFNALGLIPFQINPHYIDRDPESPHQGETRAKRIEEFLEMNDETVVGMREGSIIRIDGCSVTLSGTAGVRVFEKKSSPEEYLPRQQLNFLLTRQHNTLDSTFSALK